MKIATESRLTGCSLAKNEIILDISSAPLPGLYVQSKEEAVALRAPLKVIQAEDGLVQLAHHIPSNLYEKYGFAGGQSTGYRRYLTEFAKQVSTNFPADASVLEIGCGDGTLLDEICALGLFDVAGIDPSPQADMGHSGAAPRFRGYFPQDLPPSHADKTFDLIVCRHVLEHIETPDQFIASTVQRVDTNGELWIEVPDLTSTVNRKWWTNFYALHCNYFEEATLDLLLARHGFQCYEGQVVEIFGGSILRKYKRGVGEPVQAAAWGHIGKMAESWSQSLHAHAAQLPEGTWGWGAAERTAAALAYCPMLESKLTGLVDGNSQLHNKWMAGTALQVFPVDVLLQAKPAAVVIFALSYADEILAQLRKSLPASTPILIPSDPVQMLLL